MKILLFGNGAREHVIAETLRKNSEAKLFAYMKSKNPGIAALSADYVLGNYGDMHKIKDFALKVKPDFAFIGPEEPLSNGVVDLLNELNINAIGPKKELAKLESSKSFTRNILKKYKIEGNPKFEIFTKKNFTQAKIFLEELNECVIKPDGLTSGKGVKVQGDHFATKEEALGYCNEILKSHPSVIIEEKLEGEEFSLQCFTDGKTVVAMPPVQDHKRAFVGDKGPNTGGMGSYSCEDHLLPFLTSQDVKNGLNITKKVADALHKETGQYYNGIMYAGLIKTKSGIKLVEYNARFGDPEVMNVLPLLETDFVEICSAIIKKELYKIKISFKNMATVCKYIVPKGYPDNPVKGEKIKISRVPENSRLYYSSVDEKEDGIYLSSSRAIACLGIAKTLDDAEKIAEEATKSVKGNVFHREDIGTKKLVEKRVSHIQKLLK